MPGPAHSVFRATRRFTSLDGLRALAVTAVVWHHTQRGFEAFPASRRGYLGVDLFFVISGFLITSLLLREREEHGRIALGRFFARRSLRIFPLYYGILALLSVYLLVLRPDAAMALPFRSDLPYYATYTSNWIHAQTFLILTWSLAAEEQFYLTWAPLVRFMGAGALWLVAAAVAVGVATTLGLLDPLLSSVLGPRFRELDMVQATFNPIAFGVLVGWLLHAPSGFTRAARFLGSRGASPVCLLLVVAAASSPGTDPMGWPRLGAQLAMTALVVSCVVREDHALSPVLRWRALAWVGSVSYGVYLLHMFALQLVRELHAFRDWRFPFDTFLETLALTLLLAGLSYRYLESPFLRLKRRFAAGAEPTPLSARYRGPSR